MKAETVAVIFLLNLAPGIGLARGVGRVAEADEHVVPRHGVVLRVGGQFGEEVGEEKYEGGRVDDDEEADEDVEDQHARAHGAGRKQRLVASDT